MMRILTTALLLSVFSVASAQSVERAKNDLLRVLEDYTPGSVITDELTARVSKAADAIEQAAGTPPNLAESIDLVTGQWIALFSSQGVVGEIDVAFMTRAHEGGGVDGGKATSLVVLQELRPASRFYRNMMVMHAGENETPLLHIATADLGLATEAPNVLEVSFRTIAFTPARADVSPADVREALALGPDTPLSIELPPGRVSKSTVTYLDADMRINRGKNYIAILQKIN